MRDGMLEVVEDAGVYGVRQGGGTRHDPDDHDGLDGPVETRHGLGPQRVADGDVALEREGCDSEAGHG